MSQSIRIFTFFSSTYLPAYTAKMGSPVSNSNMSYNVSLGTECFYTRLLSSISSWSYAYHLLQFHNNQDAHALICQLPRMRLRLIRYHICTYFYPYWGHLRSVSSYLVIYREPSLLVVYRSTLKLQSFNPFDVRISKVFEIQNTSLCNSRILVGSISSPYISSIACHIKSPTLCLAS